MKKYLLILLTPVFMLTSSQEKSDIVFQYTLTDNDSGRVYRTGQTTYFEMFNSGSTLRHYKDGYFSITKNEKVDYYSLGDFSYKISINSGSDGIKFSWK